MDTKQTTIPDFTRIFDGTAAPAAPPPQVIMVQPGMAAQQQPPMVQLPQSVLEDYQRKAREAEDQARREAAQKAASLAAPPPGAPPPSEAQEARTNKEHILHLTKLFEASEARARAAELAAIRTNVISAACMQGLHPSMAQFIQGADEASMRASAQALYAQQANMEAEFAKRLVTQYGVPQAPQMPVQQQPGTVPVGYTMQAAQPFQISAPSMVSVPAPVPQGQLSMEQINQLTSHEAMMSGVYGANRNALMNGLRQGQLQPSVTQYQPTPAPMQFQPQGHQPMTAFAAPQSRFTPQQHFQPQQAMMPQQQNPLDAAYAAIDRMRANPTQVDNLVNQGFLR